MEGMEGLPADRARVWDAKLETRQTLHWPGAGHLPVEGWGGLEVNRPHARSEKP
jgi:hypothetical protein